MQDLARIIAAALIAVGVGCAGWFTGQGFIEGRAADRYVTLKGLSEREVKADVALWPLRYVATHDELKQAQAIIRRSTQTILDFLEHHGLDAGSTELQRLEVNDQMADPYSGTSLRSRYIVTQTLMVRSGDPDLIQKASQDVGKLVDAGVVLSAYGSPEGGPIYLFTRLSELKPAMIAEATAASARMVRS